MPKQLKRWKIRYYKSHYQQPRVLFQSTKQGKIFFLHLPPQNCNLLSEKHLEMVVLLLRVIKALQRTLSTMMANKINATLATFGLPAYCDKKKKNVQTTAECCHILALSPRTLGLPVCELMTASFFTLEYSRA